MQLQSLSLTQATTHDSPSIDRLALEAYKAIKKHSTTYFLVKFVVPSHTRISLAFLYSYVRWVDDVIDDINCPRELKMKFINRQSHLLENFYNQADALPGVIEEWYLFHLAQEDQKNNLGLYTPFKEMFETVRFDALRIGRPDLLSHKDLDRYITSIGEWTMKLTNRVVFPKIQLTNDLLYKLGKAAELAHLLRDFEQDLESGYINISCEDVVQFGIDLDNLCSSSLRQWIEAQIQQCDSLFSIGERTLDQVDSLRFRFCWRLFSAKYKLILIKLKQNYGLIKKSTSVETEREKVKFLLHEISCAIKPTSFHPN